MVHRSKLLISVSWMMILPLVNLLIKIKPDRMYRWVFYKISSCFSKGVICSIQRLDSMHQISEGKFFSKLRNFYVYDNNETAIGRVGDLLLRRKDMSVYALVIHDSAFREKLEDLHLVDDRDEIIPLHRIDRSRRSSNEIYTTVTRKKLEVTHTGWEIPEEYTLFSNLCNLQVVDIDLDPIGYVTDIIYHDKDAYSIVVDPATYVQHFLEILHLRHHHEIIIPSTVILSYSDRQINLSLDRQQIEEIDALAIHHVLEKAHNKYQEQPAKAQKRYHYYVLQAEVDEAINRLESKGTRISNARSMLKKQMLDVADEEQVDDFVNLFNEVALTSIDPYEQIDADKVKQYFGSGTYLYYFLNRAVGYCITTKDHSTSTAAIAGIGIHHKHRGKRFSSAIMADMLHTFRDESMEFVQCDVIKNNEASLGLFTGLGFTEIDDFYLS